MDIVFLCPPAGVINGGTKFLYLMAAALHEAGHKVAMFEQNGQRPAWFASQLPVIGQGVLTPRADQVFVTAEDQPLLLASIKDWPQKKIVYLQNQYYAALGLNGAESFASFGISALLCSSQSALAYARVRHPAVASHLIPCAIDRALFKPFAKRPSIAFMPRKRRVEAAYLRDMFRFRFPEKRDWAWVEIDDQSQAETAKLLGQAEVFLSLSRLESLGLTPLEAMASGCVVAGFTGLGGQEYARPDNGFWAAEDDFDACLNALQAATDLAPQSEARASYAAACEETLAAYTPALFQEALGKAWGEIGGSMLIRLRNRP